MAQVAHLPGSALLLPPEPLDQPRDSITRPVLFISIIRLPMTFFTLSSRLLRTLCLLASLFCMCSASAAPALIPSPPQLAAKGYLLLDANSGKVIVEHQADKQLEPASLTKMMTAYVASHELRAGNIAMTDQVRVSKKAWKMGGSKMFIRVGTEVSVDELLHGIIIQSGNDASVAMAEHIAGAEDAFVQIMNHHAGLLGMQDTQFHNAHGWPADGHVTTARDMATLARAIIDAYPEHYVLYKIKSYTYNGITQQNRNRLLWQDPSVDGLKTGHTKAAGYCLVASAMKGDMRLIAVVMGARSEEARARETRKLLAYGFRYYETVQPYPVGEAISEARVWGGAGDSIQMGLRDALYVTVPRGRVGELTASVELGGTIKAPVEKGVTLGKLQLSLDEAVISEQPLVGLVHVEQGGFFRRAWHAVKLFFMELFGMLEA